MKDDESSSIWQAPKGNLIKFNNDGSWLRSSDRAGLSCVLRDSVGSILGIEASYMDNITSGAEAEGLSLVNAMRWASHMNLQKCPFEIDCVEIFHQVQTFSNWSSNDRSRISDCANFLTCNDKWTLTVIRREASRIADGSAKKAAMNGWRWSSVLAISSFLGSLL